MQKKIIKGLIFAAGCVCSLNASAIAPGFYMGLMMGPASNTAGDKPVQVLPLPTAVSTTANTGLAGPKSSQFGSRLYLGYKFNSYAGFEMGFTYYSGINYILKNPLLTPAAGTTARVRDIDLFGKVDYSYSNTIGIYGKAGVAATYLTTPGGLNITNYSVKPAPTKANPAAVKITNVGSNTYKTQLNPAFALGVTYDLDQSWQMDVSWTRTLVGGAVGNMNLYALGLSYHFVDVYCGQFLCSD